MLTDRACRHDSWGWHMTEVKDCRKAADGWANDAQCRSRVRQRRAHMLTIACAGVVSLVRWAREREGWWGCSQLQPSAECRTWIAAAPVVLRFGKTFTIHLPYFLPHIKIYRSRESQWSSCRSCSYEAQRDILDERPVCLLSDQVSLAFLSVINVFGRRA